MLVNSARSDCWNGLPSTMKYTFQSCGRAISPIKLSMKRAPFSRSNSGELGPVTSVPISFLTRAFSCGVAIGANACTFSPRKSLQTWIASSVPPSKWLSVVRSAPGQCRSLHSSKYARPVIVALLSAVSDTSAPKSQVTPLRLESSSSLLPHQKLVNAPAENGTLSTNVTRPPNPIRSEEHTSELQY